MKCSKVLIIIFLLLGFAIQGKAQCQVDFSFKSVASDRNSSTGKIEITANNELGICTLKVYKIEGDVQLVKSENMTLDDKKRLLIKGLEASAYAVKIEWGEACKKVIGGVEGIIVSENQNQ